MSKAQEKAKTILIILNRIDDQEIKNDLVRLFTISYLGHTKEKPLGSGEEIIEKILEFLRAVADGRIIIDDKEDFGSGIPPLEELIKDFEEAKEQRSIEESQVRKALIKAVVAQKKEEQMVRLLKEVGISQTDEAKEDILRVLGKDKQIADAGTIKQVAERYKIPQEKAEALVQALLSLSPREGGFLETPRYARIPVVGKTWGTPEEQEQKTTGQEKKEALLIRISYKRPSILNLVAQELSKIPADLPKAAFETQMELFPLLISHGVGLEKLRSAIEDFRLKNPGLNDNYPIIRSLRETLEALANYGRQHSQVDGVIKNYQNEIGVDLSVVNEVGKEIPSTNSQVFLKAVVRPGKNGVPGLFAVLPAKKEGGTRIISVSEVTKQAVVPKNIFSGFLVSFKKFLILPTALLAGLRGYLGGSLVMSALFLPLPPLIKIALAAAGFTLGWKQIKGFFGDFLPQILSGVKRVELLKLFSKTVGDILYTVFTKPALGWLRNVLAAGFGAAGLLLPISIPLKILFLGIGGVFGMVQMGTDGGSFLLRSLGAIGRVGVRLSYVLAALPGIPIALIIGAILLAVLLPGFLAYQSAQTQALFLPQAGGDQTANIQSPYLSIEKRVDSSVLKNEELPKRIGYTVTITAKEKKVNIISVFEGFVVFASKNPNLPTRELSVPKTQLSLGESTQINFSVELDTTFTDSIVVATTTVSASVEGKTSTQTATSAVTVRIGSPPEDCPLGWPVVSGYINQGPNTTQNYSTHRGVEAIDIHGGRGDLVSVTHRGRVTNEDRFIDQYGGFYVKVEGVCGGTTFTSYYVHLLTVLVQKGQEVKRGDVVGTRNCTGACLAGTDHVHYQFKGLKMAPPFIPINIPVGCVGEAACGNVRF